MSQDALQQDISESGGDAVDVIVEQWRRERPDLDPSAKEITGRIIRLASLFQQANADAFEPLGLNEGDYGVLAPLRRAGVPHELTPTELARHRMMTSGGMTAALDRLERKGFVARVPNPAGRRGWGHGPRSDGPTRADRAPRRGRARPRGTGPAPRPAAQAPPGRRPHMTTTGPTLAPPTLAWAERCLAPGARIVGATRLGGHTGPWRLRVRRSGDLFAVVLRVGDPQSVNERRRFGVEAAALPAAERYGVAAPRLIGCDLTGQDASQLAVLSTHLPGVNTVPRSASRHRLAALGRAAASLSLATPDEAELPVRQRPLADLDFDRERRTGASTPLLDEAARVLAASSVPTSSNVLVHGDCWQGNLLWDGEVFTGFVDWDAAGVGQPGLDLGSLRFDAALYYGLDQLDAITEGWLAVGCAPIDNLAHWDLAAALASPTDLTKWMPIISTPGRHDLDNATIMSRRNEFVTSALGRVDRGAEGRARSKG
jgi:aminoglycoside phosphotransferase